MIRVSFFENNARRLLAMRFGLALVLLIVASGLQVEDVRGQSTRSLDQRFQALLDALLSVNTDESLDTLHKSIDSGEITWKWWWDGPDRSICARWNIRSFPTIYLIDREGVIRQRALNHLELDQAVDVLIGP